MNYLINIIFTILIFYSNLLIANDNEIIFEINKIYSALDLEYRINYLEGANGIKYSSNLERELKNDFFSSVIFYEYVENNNRLNTILKKKVKLFLQKLKIILICQMF